jgi:colicin import membrane protein
VREAEALKAQAERETQVRNQQQAERDAQIRAQQAERDARILAQQQQPRPATRAWTNTWQRIRMKVRANVIEPGEISGNPEAIFEVVQLPTGDIIEVKLRKSSGVRAYDDAVQRAIIKSSPLPPPDTAELWERVLELKFKPRE